MAFRGSGPLDPALVDVEAGDGSRLDPGDPDLTQGRAGHAGRPLLGTGVRSPADRAPSGQVGR